MTTIHGVGFRFNFDSAYNAKRPNWVTYLKRKHLHYNSGWLGAYLRMYTRWTSVQEKLDYNMLKLVLLN